MANSWQDAAKTVPVADDGDPIRVVEPEFGSGDTTAPDDAARPVIQNTAGDPDAVFDLVDDDLQVPVTTPGFLFIATKQGMYWGECDFSVSQRIGAPAINPRFPVVGWCAIDRVLTLAEIQGLKDYFAARGAVETISGNNANNLLRDMIGWTTVGAIIVGSGATSLSRFARGASNLTTLDVSNWTTSNVADFSNVALFASSLTTVIVNGGTGNPFADSPATNYANAFSNTNLTQQSIDDILTAINEAGTSNGTFDQSGGSAPSATGEAAVTNLRARGWTVTVTGGF